jgi:hypothetical protein
MNRIAIALGSLLVAAAGSAFAENDEPYFPPDLPPWVGREPPRDYRPYGNEDRRYYRDERSRYYGESRGSHRECWNPRARHFENVREGEYQDDLDYSRCRVVSDRDYNRGWR